MKNYILAIIGFTTMNLQAFGQSSDNYVGKKGTFYGSWGYNKEWYTQSNIHIKQESLGNDYTFRQVLATDKPGWDEKSIFKQAMSIPQYNYRLGYWFKDDWAFEISFDHTKYQVSQSQLLHVKGTMNHLPVDTFIVNNGNLKWQLNNGANFFLFNIVRRVHMKRLHFRNFDASLLLKAGVGFMTPHVENEIFGKKNNPGFQFGGLDIGGEAALRLTFFKYAYLEYCHKAVYANYWNLKIYEGKARQDFGCYEHILNLGFSVPLVKEKKKISKPPVNVTIPKTDQDEE